MAPVSLSNFPSAWVRSSSVSLPHCSFTLPRSCCHLPATMSRFIRDSPFCLTIRCARRSASPKARGASRTPHRLAEGSPIHRAQSSRLNFPTEKQFRSIPTAGAVGALRARQCRMPWTFQALRGPRAAPRETWHRRCLSMGQANSLKRQASRRRKEGRTMGLIVIVLLVLLLVGALPTWPYSSGWGYFPSGGLGLVLLIVLILALTGRL